MKRKLNTKAALISAAAAMVIVFAALVGTTFAWFTDSASSNLNKIISGKLDVGMNYWDSDEGEYLDASNVPLFDNDALWEPGYMDIAYLEIENRGNLSFNYLFAVYPTEETAGYLKSGKTFYVSDYLVYGIVAYDVEASGEIATRDEALELIENAEMGLTEENLQYGTMHPDSDSVRLALIVYMPTYVTSEQANHDASSGYPAPQVKLAVDVYATQNTYELDSFDDQYDAGLTPVWAKPIWRFTPEGYTVDTENKRITVNTVEALKYLGTLYDDMVSHPYYEPSEWDIVLGADLDFGGEELTEPLRFGGFKSFDGNDKTIYNVILNYIYVDEEIPEEVSIGLFDELPTTKDLTLSGVSVSSNTSAGILAGNLIGNSYSGITITDSSVSGVGFIGGMIGWGNFLHPIDFSGIQILRTDLFSDGFGCSAGGFAGYYGGGSSVTVSNSTVDGLDASGVTAAGSYVGGLFGELDSDAVVSESTITEITIYRDVYIGSVTGKIYDEKTVKVMSSTVAVQASTGNDGYKVINLTSDGEIAESDIKIDALGFPQSALHTTYNGHYYQVIQQTVNWNVANANCAAMHGHLATITSAEENAAVNKIVVNHKDLSWLGGYRESAIKEDGDANAFVWVTGEVFDYKNWNYTQPDCAGGVEFYMHMYLEGTWNDVSVDNPNITGYVCEWDTLQSYLNYLTTKNG